MLVVCKFFVSHMAGYAAAAMEERTVAMSPTSASRCCRKEEVGAALEADGLNGVRGGGWPIDDITIIEPYGENDSLIRREAR